jgi:hypothetical protein
VPPRGATRKTRITQAAGEIPGSRWPAGTPGALPRPPPAGADQGTREFCLSIASGIVLTAQITLREAIERINQHWSKPACGCRARAGRSTPRSRLRRGGVSGGARAGARAPRRRPGPDLRETACVATLTRTCNDMGSFFRRRQQSRRRDGFSKKLRPRRDQLGVTSAAWSAVGTARTRPGSPPGPRRDRRPGPAAQIGSSVVLADLPGQKPHSLVKVGMTFPKKGTARTLITVCQVSLGRPEACRSRRCS